MNSGGKKERGKKGKRFQGFIFRFTDRVMQMILYKKRRDVFRRDR